jgi:adenosylcobyric acid synthase
MQMLGKYIHDPLGIEGPPGSSPALDLLDFETTLEARKKLRNVSGIVFPASQREAPFSGYEIHMGISRGPALERPAVLIDGEPDGALAADGRIFATYIHGLFDRPGACRALLQWAGFADATGVDLEALRDASLERLADCIERELEVDRMLAPVLRGQSTKDFLTALTPKKHQGD